MKAITIDVSKLQSTPFDFDKFNYYLTTNRIEIDYDIKDIDIQDNEEYRTKGITALIILASGVSISLIINEIRKFLRDVENKKAIAKKIENARKVTLKDKTSVEIEDFVFENENEITIED